MKTPLLLLAKPKTGDDGASPSSLFFPYHGGSRSVATIPWAERRIRCRCEDAESGQPAEISADLQLMVAAFCPVAYRFEVIAPESPEHNMRVPRRHRPLPRTIQPHPEGVDLEQVAAQVRYVGSPEHKDAPSFAGQPRPRADATICDRSFATKQSEITEWLRSAIRRGHTGEWTGRFPKFVWHRVAETVYIARLINSGNGEYKGWELKPRDQWPHGL